MTIQQSTEKSCRTPALAPPVTAFERVKQFAIDNPLKFASAAILMWGMGLLLTFFLRIRYMPEVNLESVSSVLYAVAVLGLIISAYTMLVLIAPGIALANVKESFGRYANRHLACISIGVAFVWVLQLLQVFKITCFSTTATWVICAVVVFGMAGIAVAWSRHLPLVENSNESVQALHKWSPQINHITAFFASAGVTVYISSVLLYSLMFIALIGLGGDIRTASNELAVSQLVMLVLLIIFCALGIALSKSAERTKIAFIVAPTLLFMILIVTGSFSSIPAMAMKALGQGEINIARIAVTGSTCREINQTLGQRVCADAEKEDIVAVCPVMIKSRIGSQVVLEFAPIRAEAKDSQAIFWITTKNKTDSDPGQQLTRRVILDKIKMLSWQPLQSIPEKNIVDKSVTLPDVAAFSDFRSAIDTQTTPATGEKSPLIQRCGVYLPPLAMDVKKRKGPKD